MEEKRIVTSAHIFPNGMLMVFDQHGKQIPELQGKATEVLQRLLIQKVYLVWDRWQVDVWGIFSTTEKAQEWIDTKGVEMYQPYFITEGTVDAETI
jgi:hypothetical protein